jgi:hypothetical protein
VFLVNPVGEEPEFVQSLISELAALRDEGILTLIFENLLIKLSRYIHIATHTFIHRQILRLFLLNTHSTTREIINRLQQFIPDFSQLTKENYIYYKDLEPWYKYFMDRMTPRLNDRNAKFLFDFMSYLENPAALQQSTALTSQTPLQSQSQSQQTQRVESPQEQQPQPQSHSE